MRLSGETLSVLNIMGCGLKAGGVAPALQHNAAARQKDTERAKK